MKAPMLKSFLKSEHLEVYNFIKKETQPRCFTLQKRHFPDCSLKNHIYKISPLKNTFSKLLLKKDIFKIFLSKLFSQKIRFQNCSLKNDIFEFAPSRNIILIALIYSSSEELSKSSVIFF